MAEAPNSITQCSPGSWRASAFQALANASLIALVGSWLWAAAWKGADYPAFVAVLRTHAVLPSEWIRFAFAIPIAEAGLAVFLGLFAANSRFHKSAVASVAVSGAFLTAVTTYLLLVPQSRLALSGCGCGAPRSILLDHSSAAQRLIWNAVLAVAHAVVWARSRRAT